MIGQQLNPENWPSVIKATEPSRPIRKSASVDIPHI